MSRPGLLHRPSSIAAANKTIILVTGANTGIGLAIVKALAMASPQNHVLLGCRDTLKGEDAAASIGALINVNPIQLDIEDDKSVEHAFLTINQYFGKLDVLINNAGTAGNHLPKGSTLRQLFDHTLSVNVTSQAVLTHSLTPLLEKSQKPKVIFLSSSLGSVQKTLESSSKPWEGLWYTSSKTAVGGLTAWYAKTFPRWRVNAVCPGLRATALHKNDVSGDETDPKFGAVRVVELVQEGPNGVTGTFSSKDGPVPW
ncbi:hypothetical protein PV10_00170 [Exophiala mesophila]|uniref:Uncharacterized protein n=1 Tax=Exophiala mesophila TaxID=212818 RepID=A0A0D1ZNR2_EXOME|nr:uncharacterized protein PV10_00170 [Exophiala mesophila]KIV96287.1 hypothetical protein PV10_00170 [Exophiala mesophila]